MVTSHSYIFRSFEFGSFRVARTVPNWAVFNPLISDCADSGRANGNGGWLGTAMTNHL